MASMGYKTEYPLYNWKSTINDIADVGIEKPSTYATFRHANCIGCLKAGKQQWFIVYCFYPELWEKAKLAESKIGYSIIKDFYLKDLECKFSAVKAIAIKPTEVLHYNSFWALVNKEFKDKGIMPCECST